MKTSLWICLVLFAILGSACAAARPAGSTPTGLPATMAPVQPTASSEAPAATPVRPTAIPVQPTATRTPEVPPTGLPEPTEAAPASPIDPQALATVTDNLRGLLEAPDLTLTFQSMTTSPNAANHSAALLVDSLGNSYYISPDTLQPVEFTLEQPVRPSQGGSMTPEDLRAAAEQLAARQSTRFDRLKDRLVFTEGGKGGGNVFFRWEMPDTDVGGMPAILQFGFRQDGSLFSYLNSLDFLP